MFALQLQHDGRWVTEFTSNTFVELKRTAETLAVLHETLRIVAADIVFWQS